MKKIIPTILVVLLVCIVADKASAQTQQNNPQPPVTYQLIKDEAPVPVQLGVKASDNADIAKPEPKEPQSLFAPEHPGNKTREEAEKAAEENRKNETEPKK